MTTKGEYKLFQACLDMQEEEIQEEAVKITRIPFWKWALLKSLSP